MKTRFTTVSEIVTIIVVTTLVVVASMYIEVYERWYYWAIRREAWEVDELITLPIGLSLGFGIFFWRRSLALRREVATREQIEAELRAAEAKYRSLFEQIPAMTYLTAADDVGSVIYQNRQFEAVLGYTSEEWQADPKLWLTYLHPDDRERLMAHDVQSNLTGQPFRLEYRLIARNGRVVWVQDEAVLIRDEAGQPQFWQGVSIDITERKLLEEQLIHQAFHDPLTSLANRALFMDRLDHALARSLRQPGTVVVLFLDLDNFKVINDSLGHNVGDELLVAAGHRLQHCVRPGDTIGRLGGDEFTILLEDISDVSEAHQVAERISKQMGTRFDLNGHEVVVSVSIGIAAGQPGDGAEDLLRHADIAMYEAKNSGKSRSTLFAADMTDRARDRLELEIELRRAVERGELRLHYQPVVHLETGRVSGLEALVRWEHPTRGLVLPIEFIPVAEETHLILPIGEWVLREACRQMRAWHVDEIYDPTLTIGVNLSVIQFQQPDLVEVIRDVLDETGLDPQTLKLELTESLLMGNTEAMMTMLGELKDLGVQLAIDDFGTGYSSLSYLKRFPVDILKLDRSFVGGLGSNAEDTAIVRAVIAVAKALGLSVTAEGIETAEQLSQLRALGCDQGQGYYFARPQAAEAISRLLSMGMPATIGTNGATRLVLG